MTTTVALRALLRASDDLHGARSSIGMAFAPTTAHMPPVPGFVELRNDAARRLGQLATRLDGVDHAVAPSAGEAAQLARSTAAELSGGRFPADVRVRLVEIGRAVSRGSNEAMAGATAPLREAAQAADDIAPLVHSRSRGGTVITTVEQPGALAEHYAGLRHKLGAAQGAFDGATLRALDDRLADAESAAAQLRDLHPGRQSVSSFQVGVDSIRQVRLAAPRPEEALVARVAAAAPGRIADTIRQVIGS